MKAGIYHGIKNVSVEEIAKPAYGDKDLLIKVAKAGICGTDVHAYRDGGDDVGIHAENEFGHEFVGVVAEIGKDVENISIGDRVTICPTSRRRPDCGLTAGEIADAGGAFSEYVYVEEAALDYNIFKLPDTLSFDKGVLTEPLSVSTHGVRRANLNGTEKAVVYGAGTIGLCAVAALQHKGIKDIIIADLSDFRLGIAEKLGAKTFNPAKGNFMDYVKEQWGTVKGNFLEDCINADVVIDCAGAGFVINEFMNNARPDTKLVIIANHTKPVEIMPMWFMGKELTITGSAGYTPDDIKTAIETLDDENCKLDAIILQTYKQEDLKEAFEKAEDVTSSLKVVIDFE